MTFRLFSQLGGKHWKGIEQECRWITEDTPIVVPTGETGGLSENGSGVDREKKVDSKYI